MIPAVLANRGPVFEKPQTRQSEMQDEVAILVVLANLESRRTVNKILEELSTQIISCSTLSEAEQILSLRRPTLIFCDERLPDGSYIDLFQLKQSGRIPPPVVVLTRTGEWDLYMDATRREKYNISKTARQA
jgi:DNA-binding NtrC family response regulator